jgi:hypothetical protein
MIWFFRSRLQEGKWRGLDTIAVKAQERGRNSQFCSFDAFCE